MQRSEPALEDPKADWIHYAIFKGEELETAVAMSKDELVQKYRTAPELKPKELVCPVCGLAFCSHNLPRVFREIN